MGLLTLLIRTYLAGPALAIRGRLLDVGCGDKPYKDLFVNVDEYIGVDFPDTNRGVSTARLNILDCVAKAENLPFNNSSFNAVLATQLLEHLPTPSLFIKEASRVLKTGGKIILTLPLVNPIHEAPRDFYRYTEFGIRHLCQENGFKVEQINGMGGLWLSVGFIIYYVFYTQSQNKGNRYLRRLLYSLGVAGYNLFSRIDRKYVHPELPVNYLLVGIKSENKLSE